MPEQGAPAVLTAFHAHVDEAFLGVERCVRVEDDAVMRGVIRITPRFDKRMIRRRRFSLQHVNRRAVQMAGGDGVENGENVHHAAARGVHEERAGTHLRDRVAVEQMLGLRRERAMRADDMGLREQFIERLSGPDAERFVAALDRKSVV